MSIPSPYSWNPSTARDLSNLSRNNAQFSSTTEWGWMNAVGGHYFGTNPQLPSSYSRVQYNEERELAAQGYIHGTATAVGAFAVGAAATYGFWGSPLQDLAKWTNNGVPKAVLEKTGFATATAWKDALGDNASKLFDKAGMYRGTSSPIARMASSSFNFWAGLNAAGSNFGHKLGEGIGRAVGTIVGQTARGAANLGGMVVGNAVDYIAGGVPSSITGFIGETGEAWAKSGSKASAAYLKDFYKEAAESALQKGFSTVVPGAQPAVSALRASVPASPGLFSMNTVYRAKGAIGELMAANSFRAGTKMAAGWVAGGAAAAGGFLGSMFLNPVSLAAMYATDKGIQYAGDIYSNFKSVHEMEKAMVAKSDRILQFGAADNDRGIAGGFSAAQRARVIDTVQKMAAQSASSGDMFGMGSNSIFGGHKAYTDRLKELKSILNVGTDMGMFDQSRSFEEFEKKFSQTVKMVDKMSKFIKKSKGEVMALMAGMQQEGVFDTIMAANKIARRDFAAKLTGVDIGTAMMESNAFSQMSNQAGFGMVFGGDRASENRIMLSRARRAGMMTRETEARLGGEQQILIDMFAADLAMLQDQKVLAGLSLAVRRDPVTGKVIFDRSALDRDAEAANTYEGAREAGRKRAQHIRGMAYSDMLGARVEGGAFYDNSFNVKEAIATGVITSKDINRHLINMVQQRHMEMNPGGSTMGKREALTLGLMQFGGLSREQAAMKAAEYSGGFREQEMTENLAVNAERIRQDVESNRISGVSGNTAYYASKIAAHGYATTGAVVGTWFGGPIGTAIGAGLGYIADKAFGEDTDEETARYYGHFAETGKERETREAARRYLKGKSTEEIVSSMSMDKIKEAMAYRRQQEIKSTPASDEYDALNAIENKMLAGQTKGLAAAKSSALREGFRISRRESDTAEFTLDTFLDKNYVSAEYADVIALAKRALNGEVVNITEDNADRYGVALGALKTEALDRAGNNQSRIDAVNTGFDSIHKNTSIGKDKVLLSEKKARDSRRHQVYKDEYEDAKDFMTPGGIVSKLFSTRNASKLLSDMGISDTEGTIKGIMSLKEDDRRKLRQYLNGETVTGADGKALSDTEVSAFIDDLGGAENEKTLLQFKSKIKADKNGARKMLESDKNSAIEILEKASTAKLGEESAAVVSSAKDKINQKLALGGGIATKAYYEALKLQLDDSGSDSSGLNALKEVFSRDTTKLKSDLGLSKDFVDTMSAIAQGKTVKFNTLSESAQKKLVEMEMEKSGESSYDAALKSMSGRDINFGGADKVAGDAIMRDEATAAAVGETDEAQDQTVSEISKGGEGAIAVTEKSIETLKDAALVLRECARALRLMN